MTTQDFIDELRELSPLFVWSLEPDGGIHAPKRAKPRLGVRGVARRGEDRGAVFEPMGAVWYARTGEVLGPRNWVEAGDALGLLPARAADLHAAANDATWAGREGRREPIEYLQTLRSRLLSAVGLTDEATSSPSFHTSPAGRERDRSQEPDASGRGR